MTTAENARILKKARKKLEKHTQQTVVKTRRQTERVIAARHSADLDALAKQSKLLKRELKNMQGKDWVMECARLEGMLQEAFKIVQHAEAQRAESIAHQEEMRVSLIDSEHALEAEVSAKAEEEKRAARAGRERDDAVRENRVLAERVKELEQKEVVQSRQVQQAKQDTAHAERQLRTMRSSGMQKLVARKLSRVFVVWSRNAQTQRLVNEGKAEEARLLQEKAALEDATEQWKGKAGELEGDMAARVEQAEAEKAEMQAELETLKSQVATLEESLAVMNELQVPVPQTPVPTGEMGTAMTPTQQPSSYQRKPSLGSILADMPEQAALDFGVPQAAIGEDDGAAAAAAEAAARAEEEAAREREQRERERQEAAERAELARSATRIQAAQRGKQSRREMAQRRAQMAPEPVPEPDPEPELEPEPLLEPEPEPEPVKVQPEPEPEPEPAPAPKSPAVSTVDPDAFAKKVRLATKCQAMLRGKMFRRRIQAFADWDRHSGSEGRAMRANVAPESGVWEEGPKKGEPCPLQELPLNQLLVGQHFTPLGLRLARQLFLVFDQDQDDRCDPTLTAPSTPPAPRAIRSPDNALGCVVGCLWRSCTCSTAARTARTWTRRHCRSCYSSSIPTPTVRRTHYVMLAGTGWLALTVRVVGVGMTFAGFLDLYRLPDMDLARDCYNQRLTHGGNIIGIATHAWKDGMQTISGLPDFGSDRSGSDYA